MHSKKMIYLIMSVTYLIIAQLIMMFLLTIQNAGVVAAIELFVLGVWGADLAMREM